MPIKKLAILIFAITAFILTTNAQQSSGYTIYNNHKTSAEEKEAYLSSVTKTVINVLPAIGVGCGTAVTSLVASIIVGHNVGGGNSHYAEAGTLCLISFGLGAALYYKHQENKTLREEIIRAKRN